MPQAWTYIELGDAAQGAIEAGEQQRQRLDELTDRVRQGEFCDDINWSGTQKMTLVRCVDGRVPAGGMNPLGPNSAGGTESLFVADDLTSKRFADKSGTTADGYANAVAFLKNAGYELGGHTDSHATGDASGCGANDKLPAIYAFIAGHGDVLRAAAAQFGVAISDKTHGLLVENARQRTEFSTGAQLLETLKRDADPRFVDELAGGHQEVLTYLNTAAGTTLNRDKIAAQFGGEYQVFNVDVWAFEDAARLIATSEEDVLQKVAALVYYNFATAYVLAGPRMRVTATDFELAA